MRLLILIVLSVGACISPPDQEAAPVVAPLAQRAKKIEWVSARPGTVETQVAQEVTRAKRDGRKLLVYVGATWCEPCRRFHEAVERGALNDRFGNLRLVEYDLDRDGERLAVAGYAPKMIPMLTVPDDQGRATQRSMEGSVKGDGAVDHMVPQLAALVQ